MAAAAGVIGDTAPARSASSSDPMGCWSSAAALPSVWSLSLDDEAAAAEATSGVDEGVAAADGGDDELADALSDEPALDGAADDRPTAVGSADVAATTGCCAMGGSLLAALADDVAESTSDACRDARFEPRRDDERDDAAAAPTTTPDAAEASAAPSLSRPLESCPTSDIEGGVREHAAGLDKAAAG